MSDIFNVTEYINSTALTPDSMPLNKIVGVKSVQRGVSSGAGYITISPVDMSKSYVLSVSKGSAGTVAATGIMSFTTTSGAATASGNSSNINTGITVSPSLSGGTTDLTVKEYSARLHSETQIYCDGACEWQLVENW